MRFRPTRRRSGTGRFSLASEVKASRGEEPWDSDDHYAISLALRFHPGYHGGANQDLDVEKFIKPIIDAIAAGLFCDPQDGPVRNRQVGLRRLQLQHPACETCLPDAEGPRG